MQSDGTNSFTWDGRNQLVAMNLGGAAFQYDPFGRRVAKTIMGTTTNYLYDGVNPVQELAGTVPTANLLAGGIDEYFTRTNVAGTASFLADALGSTLALADSAGTLQGQYTYEPFGMTTTAGAATTNAFAYTGRELDGSGLYYYRARYYDPSIGRFISEDPAGLVGSGPHLYTYIHDNPISLTDPLGLCDKDRLKKELCRYVPEGRTVGLTGSVGLVGGQTGAVETVINYNTGEVSAFASGGLQAGWNGGLQGSVTSGFIYGLGNSNSNHSGPFTNGSVSVGPVGIYTGLSSAGLQNPTHITLAGPNVVGANLGLSLVGPVTATGSVTYYSKPLDMGNIFTNPSAALAVDYFMYLARQLCN